MAKRTRLLDPATGTAAALPTPETLATELRGLADKIDRPALIATEARRIADELRAAATRGHRAQRVQVVSFIAVEVAAALRVDGVSALVSHVGDDGKSQLLVMW